MQKLMGGNRGGIPAGVLYAAVVMFLALTALFVTHASAFEVVAVKSSDIRPYNDALAGFRSSGPYYIRELNLSETGGKAALEMIQDMSPDAVLAVGLDAFKAVKSLTNVPVFYTMILRPESLGPAQKNISGVSMTISPELYIDYMTKLFPQAKRIGLIYDPRHTGPFVKEALHAARAKGLEPVAREASKEREVPGLIDSMKDRIEVFWMIPDTTVVNAETVKYLLLFSFQNRVPVFSFSGKYVDMGAVAALTVSPFDLGAQTGELAKTVLSGQGGKSPIRTDARKAVLTINKTVAKKLGIRISEELMRNAKDTD